MHCGRKPRCGDNQICPEVLVQDVKQQRICGSDFWTLHHDEGGREVFSEFKIVASQISGEYKAKEEKMK